MALVIAIEPAFAYAGVGFCLLIVQIVGFEEFLATCYICFGHIGIMAHRVGVLYIGEHIPLGGASAAALVAAPAHIAAAKHHCLGRKGVYQFHPSLVVVLLTAFALGMSAVEPQLVHFAILGEEFEELVEEIFVIIVDKKAEFRLVGEWASRHFARYFAHSVFAQIAV